MKKLIFAGLMLLAVAGRAQAQDRIKIGSTDVSLTVTGLIAPAWSQSNSVTLSSAPASALNCLQDLTAGASVAFTLMVLNGNTTFYSMQGAAGTVHQKSWGGNTPLCGSAASAMTIKVTCTPSCTPDINYQGFTAR